MPRLLTLNREARERAFIALVTLASIVVLAPHLHLLASIIIEGIRVLSQSGLEFFTGTPAPPGARELGGIGPALAGSFILAVSSLALGLPLALGTALLIVEFPRSRVSRTARTAVMALLEMPTVLVGMLAYALLVVPLGGHSLLAGAFALAIVMLPYVVAYAERALSSVPSEYREAGAALGLPRWRVLLGIVLRVAERGVMAGVLLGLAKVLGETAPLLFTIGAQRGSMPSSLLAPGDAVPLMIYHFAATPYDNWRSLAWGGSLVLLMVLLLLSLVSRRIVGKGE